MSKLIETDKFASKLALWLTDPFPDLEPLPFSKQISEESFLSPQICLEEWAQVDSNHRPHAYQACALTG